jgi:serine/threonine-protein kinase RsbW
VAVYDATRVSHLGRRVLLVNDRLEPSEHDVFLRPDEVEVRMLAIKDRVPTNRALASDMASRVDFDLDTVEDVRLAVEEACASMISNADGGDMLICRLLVPRSLVEIRASATAADGRQRRVEPLSLRVLRTLAGSVDFWTSHDSDDGHRFHVYSSQNP